MDIVSSLSRGGFPYKLPLGVAGCCLMVGAQGFASSKNIYGYMVYVFHELSFKLNSSRGYIEVLIVFTSMVHG